MANESETIRLEPSEALKNEYKHKIDEINAQIEAKAADSFEAGVLRGAGLANQAEFLRKYVEEKDKRDRAYVWQGLRYIHDQLIVNGLPKNPLHVVNHCLVDIDARVTAESAPSTGYGVVNKSALDKLVVTQAAFKQVRIEIMSQSANTFN